MPPARRFNGNLSPLQGTVSRGSIHRWKRTTIPCMRSMRRRRRISACRRSPQSLRRANSDGENVLVCPTLWLNLLANRRVDLLDPFLPRNRIVGQPAPRHLAIVDTCSSRSLLPPVRQIPSPTSSIDPIGSHLQCGVH